MRDFKRLQTDPPAGISACPREDNILSWHAVIFGPDDTPWEGGTFRLEMNFSEDYPNKAPSVRFLTKMFHPNIYNDGQICLGKAPLRAPPLLLPIRTPPPSTLTPRPPPIYAGHVPPHE